MRFLAFIVAIILAGPVHALSCVQPDVVHTYNQADAAEAQYIAVLGSFTGIGTPPKQSSSAKKVGYDVGATFSGKTLGNDGFSTNFNTDLTIRVTCVASWCGFLPSSDPHLAVLEKSDHGYILEQSACPWAAFGNPTPLQVQNFETCARNGGC